MKLGLKRIRIICVVLLPPLLLFGTASMMQLSHVPPTGKLESQDPQPVQTTANIINSGMYTTRPWSTEKHVYRSTGVPSNGTLVEIQNAVLSNVANGATSQDCNDTSDTPPAPPGTWCDSVTDSNDGTGTVHVEIDQVYKYLGIAPPDWPINGSTVNIIGYTFMDGESGVSWEIHPVTAWTFSTPNPKQPPPTQQPQGQDLPAQISNIITKSSWLLILGIPAGFLLTSTVFYLRARRRKTPSSDSGLENYQGRETVGMCHQ